MTVPNVKLTKSDGNTGVVRPGALGILAIIASCATGTLNQPASYTRPNDIVTASGTSRLASFGAYTLTETENPILCIAPATSTAATYGSITITGGGSSAIAGTGSPVDAWNVYVVFTLGGTVGTGPITYQYSLDGGTTLSALQNLGTANTLTIPNSGVTLALGAGTILTNQTVAVSTTPPYPTTADMVASLEALRVTSLPWDAVLVDAIGSAASVAQLETWLTGLEAYGQFKTAVVSLRPKASGESEATYAAAMQAIMSTVSATRVVVCADGADAVDPFAGVEVARPTGLFVAARGEAIDPGQDVAYVALGPIDNCTIDDARGNPKYHDEQIYPGLDALGLTTLRSFYGTAGTFICNANLPSPAGSDYVYWQHARVMNIACSIAWQVLQTQLSKGVNKSSTVGPNGQRYIAEQDASTIEGLVNGALTNPMRGRASSFLFTLNRDDDISSNAGARITGNMQVVALAYVKEFDITAGFTKAISVPLQS